MTASPSASRASVPLIRLSLVTVLTGVIAGIGGMVLALLLHEIQHLAYGYSLDAVISPESFLHGVSDAAPWRRVAALTVCGLVAGLGWWLVYRRGRPLVSIKRAVEADSPPMPVGSTTAHALLQIITVALGSPLGREVAPREIGAALAGWLARAAGLGSEETRILVACGAGAGLAAVYNVPLAGALFVIEVLLRSVKPAVVIPALVTSAIATVVAWAGLGDETQYHGVSYQLSAAVVIWAVLAGPLMGLAGHYYTRIAAWARRGAPRDGRLVPWCLGVFAVIGLAACWWPQLPGNGKGPMQLGLSGQVPVTLAVVLIGLKLAATTASLRAGAEGGLLTPGLTIGGLLSVVLAGLWNLGGVPVDSGACALIGATAFLAVSMNMPVTAIVLLLEFTHVDQDFLIPILAATGGAMAMRQWLNRPAAAQQAPADRRRAA